MRTNHFGEVQAKIAATWVPVSRIRRIAERPELLQSLQDRRIPLDWLTVPDSTLERVDVPEDAQEWDDAVHVLGQRSWVVAEALYERCCEEAARNRTTFVDEGREETAERIHRMSVGREKTVERLHRTLAGVAQAIEAELPMDLRRRGTAHFRIDWHEDNGVISRWEEDPRDLRFDLRDLVQSYGELLGELSPEAAEILARIYAHDLRTGDASLPGFFRAAVSTARTVWLEWVPPTIEARLRHLQRTAD